MKHGLVCQVTFLTDKIMSVTLPLGQEHQNSGGVKLLNHLSKSWCFLSDWLWTKVWPFLYSTGGQGHPAQLQRPVGGAAVPPDDGAAREKQVEEFDLAA